jgi:alpha-glucosidase
MNTAEKTDELILHVYYGKQSSDFTLYNDDGETFQYQQGKYARRNMAYHGSENKLVIQKVEGSLQEQFTKLKFIFHGLSVEQVNINGEIKLLNQINHSFFSPLEKYDPINDPDSMGEEWVKTIQVGYSAEKIEVSW